MLVAKSSAPWFGEERDNQVKERWETALENWETESQLLQLVDSHLSQIWTEGETALGFISPLILVQAFNDCSF